MTVKDQGDFDPRLADWLEADPNTAPEPTLEIVLAAFPSIRQRRATRVPWRFPSMSTTPKLALGATAVIAVVLGGSAVYFGAPQQHVGGPPPSASPSASAAPSSAPSASPSPQAAATVPVDWTTYTSSRFAYSIDVPASWSLTPAKYDWPNIARGAFGAGLPEKGGQTMDVFGQTPPGIYVWVTSVPITSGKDEAALLASFDSQNAAFCNSTSNRHDITLDGVAMRQEDQVCAQSVQVVEVLGASKDRFFEINLISSSERGLSDTDRATFDRFLSSFRLNS
jgi:hypothetical protein